VVTPFNPVGPDVDLVALAELCSALAPEDLFEPSNPFLIAVCRERAEFAFAIVGEVSHDELSEVFVPPSNAIALVLLCGGWMAPMDDPSLSQPVERMPSRRPDRCRVHSTTLIGGAFEIVSVLRVHGHPDPMIMPGPAFGRVPEALERCWLRGFLEAA
jgi:hypothetical protein